jgi:hypothetical protein
MKKEGWSNEDEEEEETYISVGTSSPDCGVV